MVREYKETHQQGYISIENLPDRMNQGFTFNPISIEGDFGIQIAEDGRVWVCINGVAFLRFKPRMVAEASQLLDWFHERQRVTKSMILTMEEFDEKYNQLFGKRPTWYSWGPFYRDHGFVGLREKEHGNVTGMCMCGHLAQYHDRDGFCCGDLEAFKAVGPRGESNCTCREFVARR